MIRSRGTRGHTASSAYTSAFGFVPVRGQKVTLVGYAAGADETAPETFVIEAGGKAGNTGGPFVPKATINVGRNGFVLELEILPDYAGGTQGGLVHLFYCPQDGRIDTDRNRSMVARDSQGNVLYPPGSSDPEMFRGADTSRGSRLHPLARLNRLRPIGEPRAAVVIGPIAESVRDVRPGAHLTGKSCAPYRTLWKRTSSA